MPPPPPGRAKVAQTPGRARVKLQKTRSALRALRALLDYPPHSKKWGDASPVPPVAEPLAPLYASFEDT